MSTAELRFERQQETTDDELKAWAVKLIAGESEDVLGRLVQPADKDKRREWTLIRPDDEPQIVGETKLDAIRAVKQMYADRLPAEPVPEGENDESLNGPDRVQRIEARIAELEAEIEAGANDPEFARKASRRRAEITRLHKQLPTSAPHAA